MLEVGEQVAPVFDADRHAHQSIGDSRFGELLFGESGMRGGFGMAHQRLHSAERHRVARQSQIAQELERRFLSAAKIEREHAARKIALRLPDANLLNLRLARNAVSLGGVETLVCHPKTT